MHRAILVAGVVACAGSVWAQTPTKKPRKGPSPTPQIVWVNEPRANQLPLPEGVRHETFRSNLVDQDVGFCVYLPRGYAESDKRYQVIYSLHGNGGNEFTCVDAAEILHEGIGTGRWPETIMVFPNGGHSTFYKNSHDGRFPIESIVMTELIPHIDATYRTVADPAYRAIEGFSMGGRGSTRLAVKYPDMFCSLFCQAGNVPHLLDTFDAAEPGSSPHPMLGSSRANYEADDVYRLTEENAEEIKRGLSIQIACGTLDRGHLPTIQSWHAQLSELGIDHTYLELSGLAHRRTEMMARLRPIWFDHHVESMRRAQADALR